MPDAPEFEIVGPPGGVPGCSGVLMDYMGMRSRAFFQRCTVCGWESERVSPADKLAWTRRVIERVLRGERAN